MIEKQILTNRRNYFIKDNNFLLAELYGNCCYTPLYIPIYKSNKLIDYFTNKAKPYYRKDRETVKKYLDSIDNSIWPYYKEKNTDLQQGIPFSIGNVIDVVLDSEFKNLQQMWTTNIQNDFQNEFPEFIDFVYEYFPFKKLKSFYILSSTRDIPHHRDLHENYADFPSSFRILLYDSNPESTLSLLISQPNNSNISKEFVLPRLPDTNSFVWNNLRVKHGSKYNPNYKKILIILDNYELDFKKYKLLLESSLQKFNQEHKLWDPSPLKNYVINT